MCRKRCYRAKDDPKALKHIRSLRRRGFENLHVYQCDKCPEGTFHVGHIQGAPKMLDFLFKKQGVSND